MKNAGPKFLYLPKLSSTIFDLKSMWNFLNEKCRPKLPISSQTILYEIRFRIKVKLSEWKMQAKTFYIFANSPQRNSVKNQIESFWKKNAGQKFLYFLKQSSTKFDLESKWKFLNEKCRPKIPISSQTLLNETRFRITLKLSEWKLQVKTSYNFWNR